MVRNCAPENLELPRCAIAHLRSGPSDHPGMTTASSLQCLLDLDFQYAIDVLRRDGADQLVDDGSIAPDDKAFRHAIDAPLDRGAAIAVDADHAEGIAVAAEEAPRVLRHVLVVDTDELQALVLAEFGEQWCLVVTGHAP